MANRYSLAKYILSVKPSNSLSTITNTFGTISIGGEGSYIGSISASLNGTLWTTTSYATGGWVHEKDLDKTGLVTVSINQMADAVMKFIRFCEVYYDNDADGFTLTLTTNDEDKKEIFTAIDCYITKIPTQAFGNRSAEQTWTFTCGKITFN